MKREEEKRRYQADRSQSGAPACLLSVDYNLLGISETKYFTNMLKTLFVFRINYDVASSKGNFRCLQTGINFVIARRN